MMETDNWRPNCGRKENTKLYFTHKRIWWCKLHRDRYWLFYYDNESSGCI